MIGTVSRTSSIGQSFSPSTSPENQNQINHSKKRADIVIFVPKVFVGLFLQVSYSNVSFQKLVIRTSLLTLKLLFYPLFLSLKSHNNKIFFLMLKNKIKAILAGILTRILIGIIVFFNGRHVGSLPHPSATNSCMIGITFLFFLRVCLGVILV